MKIDLWPHQQATYDFANLQNFVFDTSSPGTGKTGVWARIAQRRLEQGASRVLIVCPKTIMRPAWGNDIERFTPDLTYSLAYAPAKNRLEAFDAATEFVIINVDALPWLFDQGKRWWNKKMGAFPMLVIDESHTVKTNTASRTKAAIKMAERFAFATCMSGTPAPNTVTELWSQIYILDGGRRLGTRFVPFKLEMQDKIDMGVFSTWRDKPGVRAIVHNRIKDITIGHKFNVMNKVPEMEHTVVRYEMNKTSKKAYIEMEDRAALELKEGNAQAVAVNAATLVGKLLQIASGAVYYDTDKYDLIDRQRYDLIADLVEARDQTVVFYVWKHQKDYLHTTFKRRGLLPLLLTSEMSAEARSQSIDKFQNDSRHRVLMMHPRTGGYGLTLTAATTTLFASPLYEAAMYTQACARIQRGGQTEKTESIIILANNTRDFDAYRVFTGKLDKMVALNKLLQRSPV